MFSSFSGIKTSLDACKKEIEDKCKTPLTPAEKTKAEACLESAKQFREIINDNGEVSMNK